MSIDRGVIKNPMFRAVTAMLVCLTAVDSAPVPAEDAGAVPHQRAGRTGNQAFEFGHPATSTIPGKDRGNTLYSNIHSNHILLDGDRLVNGNVMMQMRSDGNLVLSALDSRTVLWASNTYGQGTGPYRFVMQGDGNAVVYDSADTALWSTGTAGKGAGPFRFSMQSDGNAVLYDATSTPLWSSETYGLANLAKRFAPVLKFDRAQKGYPMSAQRFIREGGNDPANDGTRIIENTDRSSLNAPTAVDQPPTYYEMETFGQQVRIMYWWFYGHQHPCYGSEGEHVADWERVMVTLSLDKKRIAAVTFWQHGGHYTRIAGPRDAPCTPSGTGRCGGSSGFEVVGGTHPVVYSGKIGHGSYHNSKSGGLSVAQCGYWDDFRNPEGDKDHMHTGRHLINLMPLIGDTPDEEWITEKDHKKGWGGEDGIKNDPLKPTRDIRQDAISACSGSALFDTWAWTSSSNGCYQSECLAGDDQASQHCLKECEPGYRNDGLTCSKAFTSWFIWKWTTYGRLNSGKYYDYDYDIPHTDVGLLRRRSRHGDNEWSLP